MAHDMKVDFDELSSENGVQRLKCTYWYTEPFGYGEDRLAEFFLTINWKHQTITFSGKDPWFGHELSVAFADAMGFRLPVPRTEDEA